ncbi:MAG: complex I NDUFA9 subunit family protein [Thiotrichaceae bacterium]
MRKICVLGGTGFVGRHLVHRLVEQDWQVTVLTRELNRCCPLSVLPTVKLVAVKNLYDQQELNQHLADHDVVVNLVAILNEKGRDGRGFEKVHVALVKKVVEACQVNKIKRLLHVSALNADVQGTSHYLRTKGEAEALLQAATGLQVTCFRPSVIFGEDDEFFNRFIRLLRLTYVFPLACPSAKFAPVWVDDVVNAMINSIGNSVHYGKIYNLCGPKVYTLQQLVEYAAKLAKLPRYVMPLGGRLSYLQAAVFERVPSKPLSLDNYHSLQVDSVCSENHLTRLGVTPHALESIMPRYFTPTTPHTHYHRYRAQARR